MSPRSAATTLAAAHSTQLPAVPPRSHRDNSAPQAEHGPLATPAVPARPAGAASSTAPAPPTPRPPATHAATAHHPHIESAAPAADRIHPRSTPCTVT